MDKGADRRRAHRVTMNEFSLIHHYFQSISCPRDDVIFGIGDDAACVHVPHDMDLLVSTDTLVEGVHFLKTWDAYDIASRAVRVNVSDMAAMAATPCWITLALTLPYVDESWLKRFSLGLSETLRCYTIALVGGDTTRGPLTITITIHGLAPKGRAVRRCGAIPGDAIIVTGQLGAAALAVRLLNDTQLDEAAHVVLMNQLLYPTPRLDFTDFLREHATAAVDISDGLSADLNHILEASHVGACLERAAIPIHPLVKQHQGHHALDLALSGGDDYELCFTMPQSLLPRLDRSGLTYYRVGVIESEPGLREKAPEGRIVPLVPKGYAHF